MKRVVFFTSVGVLLFTIPAHAAIIDIGVLFGSTLQPYINAVVDGAIFVALAWAGYELKKRWGIEIDAKYRDAISTWAARQASDLVAKGAVKVEGLKIEVKNDTVAAVANTAIKSIPDAMAHFGLTPKELEERIKSYVPTVPAVAAEIQSTTTPEAAKPTGTTPIK